MSELVGIGSDWLKVTTTGVQVTATPTFEQWEGETEGWIAVHSMSPMAIGDLLNYGEEMWPEEYAQVIDAYNGAYAPQTLSNYKSVMKAVPHAVRQPGLKYNHYDAVRKLHPEEQAKVLRLAKEQHLGGEETRELVRRVQKGNGKMLPARTMHMRCSRIVEELRDERLVYVLEEPIAVEGDRPPGEVEVSVREIIYPLSQPPRQT